MNEPKQFIPDTKDCILYDSIYMKFLENTQIYRYRKQISDCWAWKPGLPGNRLESTLWDDVLKLDFGDGCTV